MSKRPMMLMSIVERDKGKKLIKELETIGLRVNLQCVGLGTAPTEMMDIFGLGSRDKDIVISLGTESIVRNMMENFGTTFTSHTKYGGVMIIMRLAAASRILTEVLNFNNDTEKENVAMNNENHNNLIVISVNEGYSEDVMNAARKAGATGGTIIKGRLASIGQFADIGKAADDDGEREILCILAPVKTSKDIMEAINTDFGIKSEANGLIIALPAEKAYKI